MADGSTTVSNIILEDIDTSFSLPFEVYMVVTAKPPLAKYHELQTIYNTTDLYDLLEMIDVKQALEAAARSEQV